MQIDLLSKTEEEKKIFFQEIGLKLDHTTIPKGLSIQFSSPIHLVRTQIRGHISVGAYTFMRGGRLNAKVGNYCSIAPDVVIGDGEHPISWLSTHPFQYSNTFSYWKEASEDFGKIPLPHDIVKATPIIGHDVWIGTNVVILRGVTIGNGAVIAAGAVVATNIPPYAIVGGVPAKIIRYRFEPNLIKKLQESKWWEYEINQLKGLNFNDPDKAVNELLIRTDTLVKNKRKKYRVFSDKIFIED